MHLPIIFRRLKMRILMCSGEMVGMRVELHLHNSICVYGGGCRKVIYEQILVTETRFRRPKSPIFSRGLRPRTPGQPNLPPAATPSRTYVLAGF